MSTSNIVLFYPRLGWMDTFIVDLPLSVIYAAHDCQQNGIEVRIVDQRTVTGDWRQAVSKAVDDNTILFGCSVMSGNPIVHALAATRYVREHRPSLPVVWGGMHVTICPKEAALHPDIDFIIRGLGSKPLYELALLLRDGAGDKKAITGLGWAQDGQMHLNPMGTSAEYPPLAQLAYDGLDMARYTRFNYAQRVYTLFTSFGCPHQCKFCFAPIFWKDVKGKRWFPYAVEEVIDHIVDIVKRYDIGYISLLDENFFLDGKRAETIFRGVTERGVKVTWGIRGARVDDLDRMGDDFFQLMSDIGVRQIMIGAESGSQRVLDDLMRKGIKVEQTIRVNQKFSRYPKLKPSYNFLSGLPNETVEDMFQSVDLILKLMEDNPQASFSGLNQLIPFPGSKLYDMCKERGYQEPNTLEGWAMVDTHYNKGQSPWMDRKTENTLHSIQAALMFADNKVERELRGGAVEDDGTHAQGASRGKAVSVLYSAIILASKLYRPIARFRLKNHVFAFPIDYMGIKLGATMMGKISRLTQKSRQGE